MILPMDRLEDLCQRMKVRIGILTVPGEHAQAAVSYTHLTLPTT